MTTAAMTVRPTTLWTDKTFEVNQHSLSEQAIRVAEAEMGENAKMKEEAIKEFREWVLKNTGLVNVRTDDTFLLRFLRARKWNVASAEHHLVKYLNFRQSIPHYSMGLDPDEGKVAELISSGYLFPSPIRDSLGRKVIIGLASKLDVNKYTNVQMAKVHALTYEALLEDEENQILGFQHIGDLHGVVLGHASFFNPVEFAMCMRIGEQAYPMRHKAVHFINMNNAFKYVYDFFATRFTSKMRDRLKIHRSLEELHNHVERRCLPKEYGGDIPMADMIDAWKAELARRRQTLINLDNMKSLIPIRRRTQNSKPSEMEGLRGSFKKLEVD